MRSLRSCRTPPFSVLSIARRHLLPIVPLHIGARISPAFFALSMLGQELRDVTLFRELSSKRGRRSPGDGGSPERVAAVDHQRCPGHEAAGVRG